METELEVMGPFPLATPPPLPPPPSLPLAQIETERAFNLGSHSGAPSRGSSYPPSPALSATHMPLTPGALSPRVLNLPYAARRPPPPPPPPPPP